MLRRTLLKALVAAPFGALGLIPKREAPVAFWPQRRYVRGARAPEVQGRQGGVTMELPNYGGRFVWEHVPADAPEGDFVSENLLCDEQLRRWPPSPEALDEFVEFVRKSQTAPGGAREV